MTSQPVKYFTEGIVFNELISFEDFPMHCIPRPKGRGDTGHFWSLDFRGYPVAPMPASKAYLICFNGHNIGFGEDHVVLVAEKTKVLIRNKSAIEKFKVTNTDQKEQPAAPSEETPLAEPRFRREDVFEAMHQSDFKRTRSCCEPNLGKMCTMDEYRGNLEFFVETYLRIAGYRK